MPVNLASTEYGTGSPIVILHGLFGSSRNWRSIAKRLAVRYHVYALDLRNHGGSPWTDSMSYPEMADDVRAFIERHDLAPVMMLGHSMGGKTAMWLALEHPRLLKALIVVDIAPVAYAHSFMAYVQAMSDLNLAELSRRSEADAALAHGIPDAAVRMFLLQNLVYREHHFDWRINLAALASNVEQLMGFPASAGRIYEGPALFLHGSRSAYVQPEHEASIHRLFPQAQLRAVADAGHWLQVDQPERFVQTVIAFLDSPTR
jgi:esterase